jgi:hypothetical protein
MARVIFFLLSTLFCIEPIGILYTPETIFIRHFTTKPGGRGYPKTNVGKFTGHIFVYEVFDWAKLDTNLKGNHKWYLVSKTNKYWVYVNTNYKYIEINTNNDRQETKKTIIDKILKIFRL